MALDIEGVAHSKHLVELTQIQVLVRQRYGVDHGELPNPIRSPSLLHGITIVCSTHYPGVQNQKQPVVVNIPIAPKSLAS